MLGRNHGLPLPMQDVPHPHHETQFGRGLGVMPAHHALPEERRESRFPMGPRGIPPHPGVIEERLAGQYQDLQDLLADNQRLAATHVALKQELEATQNEVQRMAHFGDSVRGEKDVQMREMYEKSVRLEVDLRGVEDMRAELLQAHADIKELKGGWEDLTGQFHVMNEDLTILTSDVQQIPVLKTEIENMNQELQRASSAIEYEKKGYAENYEHGQAMEKKFISMARQLEKLQAEYASSEKRGRAATVQNPDVKYDSDYGNPEGGYPGNSYGATYGMNPAGAQCYPQYGPGSGSWDAYNIQQAQGHR